MVSENASMAAAPGEPDRADEHACLNCGAGLEGEFCHRCGQSAHVHRTLSAWWHDLSHGVLHLEGKTWRTLPMLAFRPGELTRRYIGGQRARFVSPLAMFLFSVFLMFAVFSLLGGAVVGGDPTGVDTGFAEEIRAAEADVARLEREQAAADPATAARLGRQIESEREDLALMRRVREGQIDPARMTISEELPSWLRTAIRKAAENPSLLFYKVQANAYKFSWALIPISVPFLWLLFLHRRRYREYGVYDHVVFVTYSIAFMSLLLVLLVLLRAIGLGNNVLVLGMMLIAPVHIYRQLRGSYGLSRGSALWRTAALLFFAVAALSLFLGLLLALGLLG